MISHIEGRLDHIDNDRVTIDVNGVGYEVSVAGSLLRKLPKIGEKIKIVTYLNVKEDLMQLFGFASKEEKALFMHLISVSGIGPKGAMNILSSFEINRLVIAITKGDVDLLTSAQGIGKKTAQRVIIELKEKIGKAYCLETDGKLMGARIDEPVVKDAISALIALGYSPAQARQAIINSGINLGEDTAIEELIKQSLKSLS